MIEELATLKEENVRLRVKIAELKAMLNVMALGNIYTTPETEARLIGYMRDLLKDEK